MTSIENFRSETRAWLEANCPEGARGAGPVSIGSRKLDLGRDLGLWLERMAEKGWTVPTWPKEYGGAELDRDQYRVLIEELTRLEARPPLSGRGGPMRDIITCRSLLRRCSGMSFRYSSSSGSFFNMSSQRFLIPYSHSALGNASGFSFRIFSSRSNSFGSFSFICSINF